MLHGYESGYHRPPTLAAPKCLPFPQAGTLPDLNQNLIWVRTFPSFEGLFSRLILRVGVSFLNCEKI